MPPKLSEGYAQQKRPNSFIYLMINLLKIFTFYFYIKELIYRMNPSKILQIGLFLLSILSVVNNADWQGYGNMSSSNLTDLWGYIKPRADQVIADASNALAIQNIAVFGNTYTQFATSISNFLNQLWHQAWNVFIIPTAAGKDAILYGYAFRNHWMWYNGYVSNGNYVTFIIWKDYNCKVWTSFSEQGTLSQTSILDALVGVNSDNPGTDIWGKTKKFMNQLVTKDGFSGQDKAFTIIATEDYVETYILGRACVAAQASYFITIGEDYLYQTGADQWGSFLILRMR